MCGSCQQRSVDAKDGHIHAPRRLTRILAARILRSTPAIRPIDFNMLYSYFLMPRAILYSFWSGRIMSLFSLVNRLALIAAPALLFSVSSVRAFDVTTAGVDNNRTGWNKSETTLTANNLATLHKTREFLVDEKIDVSPLVVGNTLYVFTMSNTVFAFDVNTGTKLFQRQLTAPFDPCVNPGQMDKWCIYAKWGITATPVIDTATNTLYVTTFGTGLSNNNEFRENLLWVLDLNTGANRQPPVIIAGKADNGGGAIATGTQTPYQKMRAGLGLLTAPDGNKAIIVSFSINGENPNGPGHGFLVAYDVRGLQRQGGFAPVPAIWNVTPNGGAGGIWQSGSAPAIEADNIYLATGNGKNDVPGNFGESFVKLRYAAAANNAGGGKPKLTVTDFWVAFNDFMRADTDQDLGAAGVVLVPNRASLLGGGKDGILYNLNRNNLGRNSWNPHFNLPFVATYLPAAPNGAAGLPATTPPDPNWPIVKLDRALPANPPDGKSYHIHGTPVYLETATQGIVYLWGENERVKASNYDFATQRVVGFRGQGTQFASGNMPAPGGMPGGRLTVSSNGTTPGSGVVWGVYPTQGNANSDIVHGALVAYDATALVDGAQLKQLFHSDTRGADGMGNFAKYSTPIVANGKVYVGTFSNKVVQYGL